VTQLLPAMHIMHLVVVRSVEYWNQACSSINTHPECSIPSQMVQLVLPYAVYAWSAYDMGEKVY